MATKPERSEGARSSPEQRKNGPKDDSSTLSFARSLYYAELGLVKTLLDLPNRAYDYLVEAGKKEAERADDDRDGGREEMPFSRRIRLAERGAAHMAARAPQKFFDRLVEEGEKRAQKEDAQGGRKSDGPGEEAVAPTRSGG